MSQTILTTLGMMIIDEIQYPPSSNKPPITDQIGGAGPYAIIGARVISTINHASQISGIIDKGAEFPKEVESEIQNWGTGVIFRGDKSRLTTRGVNVYSEDDIRSFYYQTPKKRIVVDDVLEFPKLAESRAYHLICSILRCEEIIDRLNEIFDKEEEKKMFIFEPLPDDCIHKNLEALKRLLPKINIFTPNLDEARDLLNSSSEEDVKEIATRFSECLQLPNSGTVIRCGPQGCHISTKDGNSFGLPAYHHDQANVLDVTGGGNSFCGGFMMGYYLSNGDWLVAGVAGNIASGCIIEQIGMPNVEGDMFNGKTLKERLEYYKDQNPELEVEFPWL